HRERCAIAPRRGATSLDLRDLTKGEMFEGHVALRFSDDPSKAVFPNRLQALLEYRTGVSVARSMLWSDRWNSVDRLRGPGAPLSALDGVFWRGPRMSTLAITNPGVSPDSNCSAEYVVRLRNLRGTELLHRGILPPHGTLIATIEELFPSRVADGVHEE